jgi:hypothetical protein
MVCMPNSRIHFLEISKLVYLLPLFIEHYELRDLGGDTSKYVIAIVYRHLNQSVVEMSSSTAPKRLLMV